MGVVIRQSFYTSLISYAGIVLGYINLLYLYPRFLNLEQIGLLRTILDFAILMAFFAQAGLPQSIIRFYPRFVRDKQSAQPFINFVLLLGIAFYGLFVLIFFLFQSRIVSLFGDEAGLISQYIHLVLWLVLIMSVTALMESFARAQLNIAFPRFLSDIVIRLLQGILVTIYFLEFITFHQLLLCSALIYIASLLILILFLGGTQQFKLDFSILRLPSETRKQFFIYSAFSLLTSGAFIIIGKLDSLMVTALVDFEANAIFTTAFYMATVIEVPRRALSQANNTLMARAFEINDMAEVLSLYKKSSINMLILGSLLLIGVWANLHNIYQLMPNGEAFRAGFYVVVIIGLAKLIDMAFGPNTEIIAMSPSYWFNTIALVFMAIIGVTLNLILIPEYGIIGAAYGSGIAVILFNVVKLVFIYLRFGLQPFTARTFVVILIGITVAVGSYYLPVAGKPIIDVLYRSGLITVIFSAGILLTRSSDELHSMFIKALSLLGLIRR